MRTMRFLLAPRWIGFLLVVVLLAWGTWRLGEWQFDRLHDRQQRNAIIEHNEDEQASPIADVMQVGSQPAATDEWRVVEATGTYAVDDTVIVRYRTRDRAAGVEVVVPLVLDDGTCVLVNRGWFATDNRGVSRAEAPAPPAGTVTITGWVRRDGTGRSTTVEDQSTRAISSAAIGDALDRQVLAGFVDLRSESPEPDVALVPAEMPDLGEGPHFFYGLQWWFFGLLAVFGFLYLIYDEWRGDRPKRRGKRPRPAGGAAGGAAATSEAAEEPAVDGEHDTRHV